MPDGSVPVFVDPSGRRRRTVRTAAITGAGALVGTAGLVTAALLGAPIGPLTSLPDQGSGPPAVVAPSPHPPPATATSERGQPTTTRSGGRIQPNGQPAVITTTTAAPPPTATTATRGKPAAPPGRPSDLPTPPGHNR